MRSDPRPIGFCFYYTPHVSGNVSVKLRSRIEGYVDRVRRELRESFLEEYSSHQIAGSFALGAFITMLPTWGVGVLVFFVLAYLFAWVNKIALFASVVVFNPVVKWGVYAASLTLGFLLLGAVEPIDDASPRTAQGLVVRLLVGNLILAVIATVASYGIVYWLVTRYRARADDIVESVIEELDHPPTG